MIFVFFLINENIALQLLLYMYINYKVLGYYFILEAYTYILFQYNYQHSTIIIWLLY